MIRSDRWQFNVNNNIFLWFSLINFQFLLLVVDSSKFLQRKADWPWKKNSFLCVISVRDCQGVGWLLRHVKEEWLWNDPWPDLKFKWVLQFWDLKTMKLEVADPVVLSWLI